MKAFITGATGFVGRNFLEYILQTQPDVEPACLVRDPDKARAQWQGHPERKRITWVTGDLQAPEAYRVAAQAAPLVFHIAARVSLRNGPEFYADNTDATRCLLDALAHHPGLERLVFVSSISAVDRPPNETVTVPLTEASIPHPNTDYGRSKLQAEQAVTNSGLPYSILRPAYIYGPHPRVGSSMDRLVHDVRNGVSYTRWPFPGRASGIHVRDLADMLWTAARHPGARNRTFFAANPEAVTAGEAFRLTACALAEAGALKAPFVQNDMPPARWPRIQRRLYQRHPDNLVMKILLEDYFLCASDAWTAATGHTPRMSAAEGIAETVRWYLQHGHCK